MLANSVSITKKRNPVAQQGRKPSMTDKILLSLQLGAINKFLPDKTTKWLGSTMIYFAISCNVIKKQILGKTIQLHITGLLRNSG